VPIPGHWHSATALGAVTVAVQSPRSFTCQCATVVFTGNFRVAFAGASAASSESALVLRLLTTGRTPDVTVETGLRSPLPLTQHRAAGVPVLLLNSGSLKCSGPML